ncbi:MAG TPA: tRNA (adenosine(37)-N6)-dimethylallyltransferase MiaA, partial [Egibacteraceae bacterium]|nr:tRNA (adenosine(37)-N6)-dimethylallyltransferase MiaA [Egibacteraceae bacterium]
YRGMDIGTAKPGARERERVPHYMVDVLEPEQDCSVRWFQQAARDAIADVHRRGAVPLLVGGSGLYFRGVVDPLEFPPTDPAVRAGVEARHPTASSAHAALREADPDAAAAMDPANRRRAVRALEVIELTGRPFSSFRTAWEHHDSVYPALRVLGADVPRQELVARIDARTDAMLAAGWLEEARALRDRALSSTARQALGYAELFDHLDGRCTLDEAAERIRARTRRYAAYQARWFCADPRVAWRAPSELVDDLTRELAACAS